ncbi:MAG: phosphonate ABC transporter ATP-binding protein [Trueperaceae bacterium]|nr:phosphonate ABC transporter ATP-binding protein [Trueperaceae bacterium]
MSPTPTLSFVNLSKRYRDGTLAVDDVSFDVQPGEFLVLVGRSGAGKSTLLRCVNRLIEPTEGDVLFEGRSVRPLRGRALRELRRDIGMIFQEFNLVRRKRVLDNVLHGRLGYYQGVRGAVGAFARSDVEAAVDILVRLGLDEQALKRADQLSGGQKQRVGIARAIAQSPKLVLADEPVASLDPASSENVLGFLRKICKEDGITAVVSLHQVEYAREFADRVVAMKGGRLVFDGLPGELTDERVKDLYFQEGAEDEVVASPRQLAAAAPEPPAEGGPG